MSFSSNYSKKKHKKRNSSNKRYNKRNAVIAVKDKPVTVKLPKYNNTTKHITHTIWNIFAHDKADTDWTNYSYKKCYTIRTFEDFWIFFNNVNDFTRHQFYIMRKNILPRYEVAENINGGTCSFLIRNHYEIKHTLIAVCIRIISENLVPPKYFDEITGVYITPKKDGANLKIWFKNFEWLKANHNILCIDDIKSLCSKRISPHHNINEDLIKHTNKTIN